jgi:hypothetical protein
VDGTIGGAGVTDDALLSVTVHLRSQGMNLRDITARLVITTGATKGRHPSPATVMRMLREHDEQKAPRPRRLGPGQPPKARSSQQHDAAPPLQLIQQ